MNKPSNRQFMPLQRAIIQRLSAIGNGSPEQGFQKIYEILLTDKTGVCTPLRSDAEQEERFKEAVRPVA